MHPTSGCTDYINLMSIHAKLEFHSIKENLKVFQNKKVIVTKAFFFQKYILKQMQNISTVC